jgi:Tol biopolymer transport system component
MMQSAARGVLAIVVFATTGAVGCSNAKTLIYEHNQQIWKAYEDGSGATLLASKGENPSWIPGTKTHIAYVEQKPNSNMVKLWKADEDGKNPTALTGFDLHFDYSWSPDGKWIAVSQFGSNGYEIYKVAVDASGAVPLTNTTFADQFPAWSPKVGVLAFISARPGITDYGIFVINADGTGEKRLTPTTFQVHGYSDGRLTWSWDGKQIAFVGRWGGREEIGTIDVATGKMTQLTSPTTNPGSIGCYDPHWYDRYLFYFCADGIYRRDMDSGTASKLGSYYPNFEHSRPSADAAHVLFSYGTPPHITRIQHYTKDQADLGAGKSPGVWGADLPLLP